MEHLVTNITYLIFQKMIPSCLKPFLVPDRYIVETDELMKRLMLLDLCSGFQLTQGSAEKTIMPGHRLQFCTLIQKQTGFIKKKKKKLGIPWNKKNKWVCHYLHCSVTGFRKDESLDHHETPSAYLWVQQLRFRKTNLTLQHK